MQDLYTWGANLAKILLISFYSDRKEEVEQINAPPPLGIYDERCNLLPWQTPDLKALVRFKILSRDLFDYWFFMLWAVAKISHVHSTLAWILHIKKLIQVCLTSYLKIQKWEKTLVFEPCEPEWSSSSWMPSRRGAAMNVGLSISILLFLHSLQDPSFKDHYFFVVCYECVCVQCVCVCRACRLSSEQRKLMILRRQA